MPLLGSSVGFENSRLRFLLYIFISLVFIGAIVYIKSDMMVSGYVDFSTAKEIPSRSGSQAVQKPSFINFTLNPGYITGYAAYPNSKNLPKDYFVCAETLNGSSQYCANDFSNSSQSGYYGFSLKVPAGSYYIYSGIQGQQYKAFYDNYVLCGLKKDCNPSPLIPVAVASGKSVDNILPVDWFQP